MKTYTEQIEKPRLEIEYDDMAENPRIMNDNIGYFITCEKRYNSPDDDEELKSMIQDLADESKDADDHMEKIKTEMQYNRYGEVIYIVPVNRYEHGGIKYSIGEKHGFDHSNCGFYIVTAETWKKYGGHDSGADDKYFNRMIDAEIEEYNKWVNGESYLYTLFDENGEVEDACCGFTDIDDIKENLPDEWQDEDMFDYLIN